MRKITTIRLSPETKRALRLLAQQESRSMSSMVEKLIHDKAKERGVLTPRPLKSIQR